MSHSSPSTFKGGGVNFLGGISFTIFSHVGFMVFFGCDYILSMPLVPIFPMEKDYDISLPTPTMESSLGSTSTIGLDVSFRLY
jgi:hypothetical protein